MRAQNYEVGLLRPPLVEQLLGGVARDDDRLHGNLLSNMAWNHRPQVGLDLIDTTAGKNLSALLGTDDMLENQARIVLDGQFRRKSGNNIAPLDQAHGAKDGARGKVPVGAIHHVRPDNVDRNLGGAQHGLGHGTHQQLSDGPRRMSSHHDAVNFPLAREGENLVRGQPRPHYDFALDAGIAHAFGQGLQMLYLGPGGGSAWVNSSEKRIAVSGTPSDTDSI